MHALALFLLPLQKFFTYLFPHVWSFCNFADVAELEVLVLAFSRTSWRFVTASGEPDFRLVSGTLFSHAPSFLLSHASPSSCCGNQ
jgi:hypothetical protein